VGSLTFLGLFAMFSPSPLNFTRPAVLAKKPPQARSRIHKPPQTQGVPAGTLSATSAKHPIG
jgi:hypothetical protein